MRLLKNIVGLMFIFILSAAFTGCSQEIDFQESSDTKTITRDFTLSFGEDTRTSIKEGGKVSWCKGDVIWYYTENRGELRCHTIKEDCISATISVTMEESASFIVAFYGSDEISYNYSDMLQVIEPTGVYQDGTFSSAHLSIAKCNVNESSELIFKNMTSMLKFSLSRSDIHYISITSNDGTVLSYAEYFIDLYSEEPAIFPVTNIGDNTIYVHTGGAGTFYISLMPLILENGFNIECYNNQMQYIGTVRSDKNLTIERNKIINLGTLDERIYNQEFRLYHIYGPVPSPPEEPTPIPPDSPEYQTDREHHIFGDSYGNLATVFPDKDKGGYIFTFGGETLTEEGRENTIVAHTDQYGRVECIVSKGTVFTASYQNDAVAFSYTNENGEEVVVTGLTDPYEKNPYIYTRDPIGIYSSIVSPILDLALGLFPKIDARYAIGTFTYHIGWIQNWTTDDEAQKLALTLATGAIGIGIGIATAAGPFWIGVSAVKVAIDLGVLCMEHKYDIVSKEVYGNAVPITLGWKQTGTNSVKLYCRVANKTEDTNFNIGIIIGTSNHLLTKHCNDYKQFTIAENGTVEYEFTFSQLKVESKYYYCAFIASANKYMDSWYDYWKYGLISEFTLSKYYLEPADMNLSVQWATCNLGASNPWESGEYLTMQQAYDAAEGTGWRLPTETEYAELFACEKQNCTIEEVNGIEFNSNSQKVFLPKAGKWHSEYDIWQYNEAGYYRTSTPHRNYGTSSMFCQYFTGTGSGWYWSSEWERIPVRLVKEY